MTQYKIYQPSIIMADGLHGGLQIFELKQLADMEAGYKRRAFAALQDYKKWQKSHRQETDMIEILYGNLEGVMLRRYAENCVQIYWMLRRDFRKGFQDYLIRNKCYPSSTALTLKNKRLSAK